MIEAVPHGIARYVKNLAVGLASLPSRAYEPVFLVSEHGKGHIPASFETVLVSAPFLSAKELLILPGVLKQLKPALYHSPSFSSLIHLPCPWIVTIHDLNHLHFGGVKEKIYYQTLLKNFAQGSKQVMTVSEFSQREIAKWLGVPTSQVEIVYNALDPIFCDIDDVALPPSLLNHHLKTGNYLLFISHHSKPHKNSEMLIKAYREAKRRIPELPALVLNAKPEELPSSVREINGVVPVGKIDDLELKALFQHTRAVLFPSSYEGFGLPPLEAAMQGARLLVSDIPPHREALVDFFPPQVSWLSPSDQESWIQALTKLKDKGSSRALQPPEPEQLGRASARYGVSALAEHMDRIYRRVLKLP